jgi:hypothetical protein
MTPWWTERTAALIGAIGGGGLGTLAGLFGSAVGMLVPRGKGKTVVLTIHTLLLVVGVISLVAGIAAVSMRQPYHVYFPLLLIGVILTIVLGGLLPVVRRGYRIAEQRRMDAAALRRT